MSLIIIASIMVGTTVLIVVPGLIYMEFSLLKIRKNYLKQGGTAQ